MKIKRALLSVSSKEGLVEFARGLANLEDELTRRFKPDGKRSE